MPEITARLSTALADRYKIESHLGEGGMANVYLAEDLKHHRKVAVKVLRPELAAVLGAERFVKEIETTANLQHPHILPLFDSGEADSFLYYVMPFIDGETLRDKLNRETQLGIDEAVGITTAIADALDYAHRNNVIHRDIKPENILLHDGRPMVADFGIALALSAAAGGRMTETGMSLGTPHYMSPEQATADKDLTNRSDIYSLGAVLYEMLTGDPPHTASSAQAIVMKIVSEDVQPVTELRKSVPPHVAAATAKSLEKLAADRFETAKEFGEAVTNPAFTLPTTQATPTAGSLVGGSRNRVAVGVAAVAVFLGVMALWGWLRAPAELPRSVARYSLRFPDGELPQPQFGPSFAWSPDGARFVYSGTGNQLWVRERDQLSATLLRNVQGNTPVFSPDGQSIACVCGGAVRIASIIGGPSLTLIDSGLSFPLTLDWEADGYIYLQSIDGLARIPDRGGELEVVLPPVPSLGAGFDFWMDVLPSGRGALTVSREGSVGIADFETGVVEQLLGGVFARYAGSGHVVVVRSDGSVVAAPFDAEVLKITGAVIPLFDGVGIGLRGGAQLALSQNGLLVYRQGGAVSLHDLVWVTRDGTIEEIDPGWTGSFSPPALSPDGTLLAVGIVQSNDEQLWIKTLDRGPLAKLTSQGARNMRPAWAPDGRTVAFSSDRGTNRSLYMKRADGSAPAEPLLVTELEIWEVAYSPNGEWLLYRVQDRTSDLYAMQVGVDSTPVALVATEANEREPALSPDGRWLAYISDESGQYEVYVRPFPNTNDFRWLVSINGGTEPVWAHSGRELFYKGSGELISVDVLPGITFITGEQRSLFSLDGFEGAFFRQYYDVTPDDQRFVMVRRQDGGGASEVIVVENFFEELKAKVGN